MEMLSLLAIAGPPFFPGVSPVFAACAAYRFHPSWVAMEVVRGNQRRIPPLFWQPAQYRALAARLAQGFRERHGFCILGLGERGEKAVRH